MERRSAGYLPGLSPMKRILQHPPEPLTGKRYWRGLGELSDTPEFREWLEREFPAGAAEMNGEEWSRRSFLKLMGASMALAGFGLNSCRRPEAHLVPFTNSAQRSKLISPTFARRSWHKRATASHSWSRKRIRPRASVCARNWRKCFRACVGSFTNHC